jgi:hypothetical protein
MDFSVLFTRPVSDDLGLPSTTHSSIYPPFPREETGIDVAGILDDIPSSTSHSLAIDDTPPFVDSERYERVFIAATTEPLIQTLRERIDRYTVEELSDPELFYNLLEEVSLYPKSSPDGLTQDYFLNALVFAIEKYKSTTVTHQLLYHKTVIVNLYHLSTAEHPVLENLHIESGIISVVTITLLERFRKDYYLYIPFDFYPVKQEERIQFASVYPLPFILSSHPNFIDDLELRELAVQPRTLLRFLSLHPEYYIELQGLKILTNGDLLNEISSYLCEAIQEKGVQKVFAKHQHCSITLEEDVKQLEKIDKSQFKEQLCDLATFSGVKSKFKDILIDGGNFPLTVAREIGVAIDEFGLPEELNKQEFLDAFNHFFNPAISAEEILGRYKRGQFILIESGMIDKTESHCSVILFYKKFFVLCNRGIGATVEDDKIHLQIYEFRPENFTTEIIQLCRFFHGLSNLDDAKSTLNAMVFFETYLLPRLLNGIRLEISTVKQFFHFKRQSHSNCTKSSLLAAFKSIVFLKHFEAHRSNDVELSAKYSKLISAKLSLYLRKKMEKRVSDSLDDDLTISKEYHKLADTLLRLSSRKVEEKEAKIQKLEVEHLYLLADRKLIESARRITEQFDERQSLTLIWKAITLNQPTIFPQFLALFSITIKEALILEAIKTRNAPVLYYLITLPLEESVLKKVLVYCIEEFHIQYVTAIAEQLSEESLIESLIKSIIYNSLDTVKALLDSKKFSNDSLLLGIRETEFLGIDDIKRLLIENLQ